MAGDYKEEGYQLYLSTLAEIARDESLPNDFRASHKEKLEGELSSLNPIILGRDLEGQMFTHYYKNPNADLSEEEMMAHEHRVVDLVDPTVEKVLEGGSVWDRLDLVQFAGGHSQETPESLLSKLNPEMAAEPLRILAHDAGDNNVLTYEREATMPPFTPEEISSIANTFYEAENAKVQEKGGSLDKGMIVGLMTKALGQEPQFLATADHVDASMYVGDGLRESLALGDAAKTAERALLATKSIAPDVESEIRETIVSAMKQAESIGTVVEAGESLHKSTAAIEDIAERVREKGYTLSIVNQNEYGTDGKNAGITRVNQYEVLTKTGEPLSADDAKQLVDRVDSERMHEGLAQQKDAALQVGVPDNMLAALKCAQIEGVQACGAVLSDSQPEPAAVEPEGKAHVPTTEQVRAAAMNAQI